MAAVASSSHNESLCKSGEYVAKDYHPVEKSRWSLRAKLSARSTDLVFATLAVGRDVLSQGF